MAFIRPNYLGSSAMLCYELNQPPEESEQDEVDT